MTAERHARVSSLFLEAVDLPPPERESFLREHCGTDYELRRELDELLRRDARPAAVDSPAADTAIRQAIVRAEAANPALPRQIGRYQIIDLLGQGGMGTVYRAQQSNPSRLVALKVVNPALLTPSLVRRFEFEAQVLAELNHPGIAQIFEAGTAEVFGSTVPFFAMELIDGQPLTAHAAAQRLDRRARLALLGRVCDAVHHAHQKGVIHRDLKPGNILVDSAGQPKILDFGIARATAAELRSATLETQPGQLVGTLPYMSPEQVSGEQNRIDTRSDVYALGVMTFELLTGRLPHELSGSSLADAVRIIATAEPARLSAHDPTLRGDVETIVAKATERDITRRYPSAAELGREIERYLAGEALEARRDSGLYVLRKALARHKRPVAVGGAFILLLAVATVVSFTLAVREGRERRRAEQNARETQQVAQFQSKMLESIDADAMGRGVKERFREQVRAGLERQIIGEWPNQRKQTPEEVDAALRTFDTLTAPAQASDIARRMIDEFMLLRAASGMETQFADQPLVHAQLRQSIGDAYRALGMYAEAETHLRRAVELRRANLGPNHIETAEALARLADALHYQRRDAEAEPLTREAWTITKAHFGPENARTATAQGELATALASRGDFQAAEPLHREALATLRRVFGDRSAEVATSLSNFGELLRMKGDYAGAEAAHREALDIRTEILTPPHMNIAISQNNLANLLTEAQRFQDVEPLQRGALETFRQLLGDEHPHTVAALHNLANTLRETGDLEGAEAMFREAISREQRIAGADNPGSAHSLTALGLVLQARGRLDDALEPMRAALALVERHYDPAHPSIGTAVNNLAALHHARREFDAAEPLYRRALNIRRNALGPNHPDVAGTCNNLAAMLRDQGKFAAAEPLYREAIAALRENQPDSAPLGIGLAGLGRVLLGLDRHADAEPILREAIDTLKKYLPADDERLFVLEARLGIAMAHLGKFPEAERLLTSARDTLAKREPHPTGALTIVIEGLVVLEDAQHKADPTAGHDTRAGEWRLKLEALRAATP